ncbi:MAG TPA: RNA 2',3'-cyclic phosphodiesterase [Solirubrobacteraceae bacterium]
MTARLFVALELPVAVRTQLAQFGHAAAERDPALRAVGEEAMHLTLAFVGHRPEEEIDAARAAVRAVHGVAPALALAEPLWLAPRRPHVLTVGLEDGDGTLAALRAEVVDRLSVALAWEPEARRFRPHVTVARVRRGAHPRTRHLPDAPHASFAGEAVVLYRSHLGGGPARYEPLEELALAREG